MPLFGKKSKTKVEFFKDAQLEKENSKTKSLKKTSVIVTTSNQQSNQQLKPLKSRTAWNNNENTRYKNITTPARVVSKQVGSPNTLETKPDEKKVSRKYKRHNSNSLPPILRANFNRNNESESNNNTNTNNSRTIVRTLPLHYESFKKKIQKYCNILYKYLRDTGTCFVKGTFVIDDKNGNLKNLLLEGSDQFSKLKKIFASHLNFGPYSLVKAKKLGLKSSDVICKSTSGICEINLNDVEIVDVFCFDKDKESENDKLRQQKANIKFYFFNNTDTKPNNQRFVFFKLERFKTISAKHALSAIKRYKIRKAEDSNNEGSNNEGSNNEDVKNKNNNTELDEIEIEAENNNRTGESVESVKAPLIRREDCEIDTKGCACKNLNGATDEPKNCEKKYVSDPEYISIYDNKQNPSRCFANYDTHKRIGDEYFVNVKVNNRIVEMVQNDEPIDNFEVNICAND
jgi:hypothetical protein